MRYLPLTSEDRRAMLAKIGVADMDALFRDVPKSAQVPLSAFDLSDTQGELEVERALSKLAARNVAAGAGPFFCAQPCSRLDRHAVITGLAARDPAPCSAQRAWRQDGAVRGL